MTKADISETILRQLVKEMGAVVRFQRHRLGLTQEELAQSVRITPGHLSQIESGKKTPSFQTIVRLAVHLNMSVDRFIHAAATLTQDHAFQAKVDLVNYVGEGFNKALEILGDETGHGPAAD